MFDKPGTVAFIVIIAHAAIFISGYLLRFHKVMWFLSGYRSARQVAPDALCASQGNHKMLIGITGVATGLVVLLQPQWFWAAIVTYVAIALAALVRMSVEGYKLETHAMAELRSRPQSG